MKRAVGWFVLAIGGFYLSYVLLLYVSQEQRIYQAQPGLAVAAPALVFDRPGARVRVSYEAHDGADAVVYFGGNAEDTSRVLPDLRAAFPGRSIYVMHYRGYQGSTGKPSEAALVSDAFALFDDVATKARNVRVIGRSLGTGIAVQVAAARPIEALVLITPYEDFKRVVQDMNPLVPVGLLLRDRYESAKYAPLVKAPVILIAGAIDQLIPVVHAEDLAQRFPQGHAVLHVAASRGHNDVQLDPQFWNWVATAASDIKAQGHPASGTP
ncbi:hypothetical protein C7S18_13725 [Ahniella affigens]|uniref:Serine aminopeptidase S33 domain-containing protein n=1 Tax=Ahniella affigens TaxID=2021234 RepID=A0A2P1PTL0_9GAMM|nr:alpha/beta hydrolase [Ahniella affigens]AVP98185.1 hypothetical protein C7S18_13725 [Ahniella affigens]